ncbi:hypothetical protein CPA40_05970 [Bifidobacterium callitrichos]|uniref:Uncharacterized protein n=1 Tax=Bifidobacterium callitrichos TaxID=762209 RepID=A0A2T3GAC8_9BIFI|nr:hypothetical protein CPA40_05970 [Bifidobacterium callitrichos]
MDGDEDELEVGEEGGVEPVVAGGDFPVVLHAVEMDPGFGSVWQGRLLSPCRLCMRYSARCEDAHSECVSQSSALTTSMPSTLPSPNVSSVRIIRRPDALFSLRSGSNSRSRVEASMMVVLT